MSLVRSYHETSVVILVRLMYIRAVSHQIFHYIQTSVKARRSERRAEGLGGVVHVGVGSDQPFDDPKVAGTGSAP